MLTRVLVFLLDMVGGSSMWDCEIAEEGRDRECTAGGQVEDSSLLSPKHSPSLSLRDYFVLGKMVK